MFYTWRTVLGKDVLYLKNSVRLRCSIPEEQCWVEIFYTWRTVLGGEVLRISRACRKDKDERGTPDTFRITSPTLLIKQLTYGFTTTIGKETVSLILSDPSCKDGSSRFTTVLCKALFFKNWLFSVVVSLYMSDVRIFTARKHI